MRRALDLFCKAGGATKGLQRAGYHVTGVDIRPQPNYCGDKFIQADAMTFPLKGYDFIWASPPCQGYTEMEAPGANRAAHAKLIIPLRKRLERSGTPWAIENVMGAAPEMPGATMLCGTHASLGAWHMGRFYQLRRHRLVLTSFTIRQPECIHRGACVGVYGGHARCRAANYGGRQTRDPWDHRAIASEAMGIDWMNLAELSEAIPPVYSQYISELV